MPTTLRPALARAVRSIFAQDVGQPVQLMLGIDVRQGDISMIDGLRALAPDHVTITVLDLGYSTARCNGGLYSARAGGALRTILSYAADSRYVAYLDDDNWWAPNHLSSMLTAIQGFDWAYALRWFVHPESQKVICKDEWASVGPGKGIYAKGGVGAGRRRYGGFVDTNCMMIDKLRSHWALPAWCVSDNSTGRGDDRLFFETLRSNHSVGWTGQATVYYVMRKQSIGWIRKVIHQRTDFAVPPPAAVALGRL